MRHLVGVLSFFAWTGPVRAANIAIPNASFELPATLFVDLNIDSWQRTAKPDWYSETNGFLWSQLTGTFKNPAPGSADHLDNCDGSQAVWMFAIPEAGLFQDYNSVDGNDPVPTHAFAARFEAGNSYTLTVGINGGGGGMSNGATMRISLYYRDDTNGMVTVGATTITNNLDNFPNHTHLADFEVRASTVRPGDAWAGRTIGVQMLSTVTSNLQGGYWDLDNVRLSSTREPALTGLARTNGLVQFTLLSEPGLRFEIMASTDAAAPLSTWTSLGTVTNDAGILPFLDTATNFDRRLYRARQLP